MLVLNVPKATVKVRMLYGATSLASTFVKAERVVKSALSFAQFATFLRTIKTALCTGVRPHGFSTFKGRPTAYVGNYAKPSLAHVW